MTERSWLPLSLTVLPFLAAVVPSQSLEERVRAVHHEAAWADGGLTGAGAEHLLEAARAAEFLMLGESHGNAETPALTGWLLRELKGSGYGALALETGPSTTPAVVAAARTGGAEGVVRFNRQNPFAVAFLYWREEARLLDAAVRSGYEVWGLDQEFMGSPRFLLSQLAERAESDAAKKLAAGWLDRARQGFAHFVKTGNQSKAFMSIARPADWRQLTEAFADEKPELQRMLRDLQASQTIYGHYQAGRYYQNNSSRIQLMKRYLVERLKAAPQQKVIFKFGSAHMGRGYSPFHQLDVGNHAAEAAVMRGGDSLHVSVFARGSVQKDGTRKDYLEGSPHLAVFADVANQDGIGVFDLRSLRPYLSARGMEKRHPELQRLAFQFDTLILYPGFHASEPVIPLPGRR